MKWRSGKFIFLWKIFDNEPKYLSLVFLPEEQDFNVIPYANGPTIHGKPVQIYLGYSEEQAEVLLGNTLYKRLNDKELLRVKGNATVIITQLSTGIDCDERWFAADIDSVVRASTFDEVSKTKVANGC